jgi:3-hydroxybutyrate dehydrogenase
MDFRIDVQDKVAIVTGGAQGMGRTFVKAFLSSGAQVVVADIAAQPELEGQKDLKGKIRSIPTDITNPASVHKMMEETLKAFGKVDILVNNAGIMHKSPIDLLDIDNWKRVMEVNVTGAVICTREIVPEMKKRNWGRIINISSMQAMLGSPTYSAYTASKAALSGLTRVWAAELAPYQITVNAICPSYVETPMLEKALAKFAQDKGITLQEATALFLDPIPQKRFLKPEEIAFSILFLSSPLAQGITGHDLLVDAGYVMR